MQDSISVRIMSPVAVVWEAQARSLSAENSEGPFDILPDHARFLSLVSNKPISVRLTNKTTESFVFDHAMLFFEDNAAVIYIQEAINA